MKTFVASALVVLLAAPLAAQTLPAGAQAQRLETGTLVIKAPVFLYPDPTRTPLVVLGTGTTVTILQKSNEWYQIEFQDAVHGKRAGYVRPVMVRVVSTRDEPRQPSAAERGPQETARRPPPPAAATASYETPELSVRPYFVATDERLAAKTTFNAAFGRSVEPFLGLGVQLALRNGLFVDVGVSRFRKGGQRAFISNGQTFQLGIPLTATVTPLEVSAGYRLGAATSRRIIPYAGVGVGRYSYQETSDFAATGDDVDTHHSGYLVVGGLEFRVHRWIAITADAQYTHVPGILGLGGVSKDAATVPNSGETDLGGVAGRFKVLVGR